MYNYNIQTLEAHQRQADMLKEAKRQHLVTIAQSKPRRIRLIGWRLPALHLSLFNRKPAPSKTMTRRTVSDNI